MRFGRGFVLDRGNTSRRTQRKSGRANMEVGVGSFRRLSAAVLCVIFLQVPAITKQSKSPIFLRDESVVDRGRGGGGGKEK